MAVLRDARRVPVPGGICCIVVPDMRSMKRERMDGGAGICVEARK
jgi:hypothetical protein